MRRALTVVAATTFAVGGLVGPAAAAVAPLPICEEGDGYIPGETCDAAVAAAAVCPPGGAMVEYVVRSGAAGGSGTVDITWTGLPGGNVLVEDQPLSGELAWPDDDVESVVLVFATTPAVSVPVAYPCEEDSVLPVKNTDRGVAAQDDDASGVLAETGSNAVPLVLGGGALVLGGAAAVMVARRNRGVGAGQ